MEINDIISYHWQIFLRLCRLVRPFNFLLCFPVRSFIISLLLVPRFEIRNGNSLRLFRVKEQDEGTYTCTSENSVGKTEASAMLQVHGRKHIMHSVHNTHAHVTTYKSSLLFPVQCSVFLSVCLCESPSSDAARSLY